ncbi:MAG TPA: L-histidine N(alpha)-methyltransferase [Terriglobia bacterium]|nr:L-histidine N(alpha)-methyltransferase [Terriglobia bacterium]
MLTHAIRAGSRTSFAEEVRAGLTKSGQKELPSKYLYDELGSALFEAIGLLPEYGLTRADERLLSRHASEIVARLPRPVVVAELGSGSGKKTRWILEALSRYQRTTYYPIEISPAALEVCRRELGAIDSVSIVGFEREYLDGLIEAAARRQTGQCLAVLFLGSTIGNFDRPAAVRFLREVRRTLQPGDALLLGTDLEKPVPDLLEAYADALGITAAFNLNLLARLNRELDANFDLARFRHLARYNAEARSVEMHLRSTAAQTVVFGSGGWAVSLAEDETLWTESSHKYAADEVTGMALQAGFRCDAQWIDGEWPFAESLLLAE